MARGMTAVCKDEGRSCNSYAIASYRSPPHSEVSLRWTLISVVVGEVTADPVTSSCFHLVAYRLSLIAYGFEASRSCRH